MIENMREEGKCKIIIIINTFWYIDQDHTTIKVIMEVITIIEVKEVTHHLKECHHLIFNLIFSLEIKNSKADFQIIEMGSKNILLLQQII